MLFWVLNHSYVMKDLWDCGSPNRNPGARDRLAQLRNSFQHLVRDLQAQLGIRPAVSNGGCDWWLGARGTGFITAKGRRWVAGAPAGQGGLVMAASRPAVSAVTGP